MWGLVGLYSNGINRRGMSGFVVVAVAMIAVAMIALAILTFPGSFGIRQ
jgi:hypothetical protein